MGKEIGRSYKYDRSKISTPTLKKPLLSSSANHTSYTTNLTRTIISFQIPLSGHYTQVIRKEHPYHLNLIINTLLQIKTRTTPQIQMTSTHV